MRELKRNPNISAFFTSHNYLSINRDFINEYLVNKKNGLYKEFDEVYITVDGIEFNMDRLCKYITYHEHKEVVRYDGTSIKICKSIYQKN